MDKNGIFTKKRNDSKNRCFIENSKSKNPL